MNQLESLKGPVAVTATPVIEDGRPDFAELQRQTEWLCGKEITALFPCSSTGEFVRFQFSEKAEILRVTAQAAQGHKKLIAGICGASAGESEDLLERAKEYEYDACVICPPYYYPQSQEDIVGFYREIADRAEGMKLILYHVPFFTSGLSLDTICRLMEREEIVGIKDSSANLKQMTQLNGMKSNGFLVYTGTDDCLLPALVSGCDGSMTALAGIIPEWVSGIYQAFRENDLQAGQKRQRSVLPLLRLADSLPFPLGYKLLAKIRGLKIGVPFQTVSDSQLQAVEERMRQELRELTQGGYVDEGSGLEEL